MDQQINQQNKAFIETPALCSYTYEIQLFPLFISKLSPMTATPSPLEIWTERQIKHAYLIGGEQDCIHLLNESMSTEEIWLRERGWVLWPAEFGKKKENSSLFQHGSLGATLAGLPLPPLCSAVTYILPFWGFGLHVSIATAKSRQWGGDCLAMRLYYLLNLQTAFWNRLCAAKCLLLLKSDLKIQPMHRW